MTAEVIAMVRRRHAFTLIELLVVIGIIGVLIAVLLPVIASARVAARNTQCAARLHELTAACTLYLHDYRAYPERAYVPLQDDVLPNIIPLKLLNRLGRYLGYGELDEALQLWQVPPIVQCPFAEQMDAATVRGPVPLPGGTVVVTG
jgi:prepilin-type N-terminal cleavage/methylation domain-containing protein